jgi:hypothetical protein
MLKELRTNEYLTSQFFLCRILKVYKPFPLPFMACLLISLSPQPGMKPE